MVTADVAGTGAIGRAFAALVAGSPHARHVRAAWARVTGSQVDFWLLTDAIDVETEMDVRAVEQQLAERYPTLDFEVRVINPRWFDQGKRLDLATAIPGDATPLPIR